MMQGSCEQAKLRRYALTGALLGLALLLLAPGRATAQSCPVGLQSADLIDHDLTVSFCELCETGTVRLEIVNPYRNSNNVSFSDITIHEDLGSSGLTYAGNANFSGVNLTPPADFGPNISGANGAELTWDLPFAYSIGGYNGNSGNQRRLVLQFDVRRNPSLNDEEGLHGASRQIEADVTVTPSCGSSTPFTAFTGNDTLPFREPELRFQKRGRNVDANQGGWSRPVYAHENDDVIWRIRVRNTGDADLQDFEFTDQIVPGNFLIDWVCDDLGDATNAANGSPPSSCYDAGGVTSVPDLDVEQEFGNGTNPYIVVPAGGTTFFYFVGRVIDSCSNRTNTADQAEWGCEVDPGGVGGIAVSTTGVAPSDSATLSTLSVESGLNVNVALTGENPGQAMGSTGMVTITITNNTGGTIVGGAGVPGVPDGIRLQNLLPPQYVIDPTFDPSIVMDPAYGIYDGMVDRITWENPANGTHPVFNTTDPLDPLANDDLEFTLWSSTTHPVHGDQKHMIRHGDEVTITFRTVLIDPQYYDKVANLDVRLEEPASSPAGTDPTESFQIDNRLDIWFEEFCTGNPHQLTFNDTATAAPEDLDVDMVGTELLFILTSTGDPLPLTVELTNDGGHDADDYLAYVTFGQAMTVATAPSSCQDVTPPPPALVPWQIPADLPATATLYLCDSSDVGTIAPGQTVPLLFEVVKTTAASYEDDLTFRADVTGQVTLSDGTPLWFPVPTVRADGILDPANDYTIDAVRARVVGYDLLKTQLGTCNENNPPPASPDVEIQIGEECEFHIESGGWFGFQTPGFTYIAVQRIQVVDGIPDGQGYIAATDPLLQSTTAIKGIGLDPPHVALAQVPFGWTFNTDIATERITERDHWFRVDVTTRLANDAINSSAAPNNHAVLSSNIMTSTFEAVFFNSVTNMEEVYSLGPNTIGFPREVHRRVDLTVTEPNLTVVKEVCNETLYGAGGACSSFVPLADDGDAFDTYVYRVTVTNEAANGGVPRAPAYDVTVTNVTDPSDRLFVVPLTGDALDNDGDALVDSLDAAGEGTITDNTILNLIPAEVIASHTHSDALKRIDAGESVVLYYRVDPDDDVAPLQQLTSSVSASYDSLEGDFGNQSTPQEANGLEGGSRQYVSPTAQATIQIVPVEVRPKEIIRLSNSPLVPSSSPQPVSIGEELEFQLHARLPVAQLRSFVVRDMLPPGLSCVEAPTIDLGAPPFDVGGFVPGGAFAPTCTADEVSWSFGDQTVTRWSGPIRRFDFVVDFIARVDNIAASQDGVFIRNGGTATTTEVNYIDETGTPVAISFDEATTLVGEPLVELTKAYSVGDVDADDLPRILVTVTNNGTAPAYNLRILDDLLAAGLSFAADLGGTDPPTTVDLTAFGPDRPVFTWGSSFALAPGAALSFSFAVRVDSAIEPHTAFPNTIEADWTSLPNTTTALNAGGSIGPDGSATGMRIGAIPNAGDSLNDYEAQANASIAVPALVFDKIDVDPGRIPRIGSHHDFQLVVDLPEGVSQNVAISDDLSSGSVSYVLADNASYDVTYDFIGIATINGQAPSEAALTAVPADGASGTITWSIGSVATRTEDDLAVQVINPRIRINYSARIENDLATNRGETLQNTADLAYTNGETAAIETLSDLTAPVIVIEPELTAIKTLSNVTGGKTAADPPAFGDTLEYVVTATNSGNSVAFDVNVTDTLPPELTLDPSFTPTARVNGSAVTGFNPTPNTLPGGTLAWGRGNLDTSIDVPAGGFVELTYRVRLTTPIPDPSILDNLAYVDWTSLDQNTPYDRTGDGCPNITAPNDYCFGPAVASGTSVPLPTPGALLKANTQLTAAVGEAFSYRITVPASPYAFPLNDVRIHDDLTTSAANLRFLGVTRISGSGAWTPVNSGTATDLVIEDPNTGIDIPAGEQIVVEISVVLEDTAQNVTGLPFANTASYIYNWVDDDPASVRPGDIATSPDMTIVGPDQLELQKSGPATITLGTPAVYTLDVRNAGDGRAWNPTLVDLLPNLNPGGTCDVAPAQITAQVFEANGTTPVSAALVENTDFTATFAPDPTCTLTLEFLGQAASVGAGEHLIIQYETNLDFDTPDAATLTNVAGAVQWFSADGSNPATAGDRRTATRTITNGTTGTLDHEDAHTLASALPIHTFEKTVANLTTGVSPATQASPGDRLRYTVRVENVGATSMDDFIFADELDRLNAPPAFEPGSLNVVIAPVGADASNTNAVGGSAGTGSVEVSGLNLPNSGDSALIVFEATLASVIPNGSLVLDQAELRIGPDAFSVSDDPNVNGPADPNIAGDEDPTQVQITSAPAFQVEKTSRYVSGDPAVLLAGETLRYTLTVKNVGTDNATDVTLRDALPVNTSYVAGTTTLNGNAVPDGPGASLPLAGGLLINAPEDPTPGAMRADASATPDNVATIRFDVVVDFGVIDGTVISNQALVSSVVGGVIDHPSDDPRTAALDDPTRDVVGSVPLLFASKNAALLIDNGLQGVVDPDDVLRYTITVYNNGAVPATGVTLQDAVPANTIYQADSLMLNGIAVGPPGSSVSPLAAGIPISSSDLTPPLPAAGAGTLSPGESAVIVFDLQVAPSTLAGTVISNQALVTSADTPSLLTDGDGNPATGPEPTLVVVGAGQQLAISKQVNVVSGGQALAGSELEYVVSVSNIGSMAATNVVIVDDLDAPTAGQLSYVPGSATLNGVAAGVTLVGTTLTADYSTANGPLPPGGNVVLRFRATIDAGLALGTTVTNVARVDWNSPVQTANASVSVAVGGMPGVAALNGRLWHDSDFDRAVGGSELVLSGWLVDFYRNGQVLQTVVTDGSGRYGIASLDPNDLNGDVYALRFRAPDASAASASLGTPDSPFSNGPQQITNIVLTSGSNLQGINLPISPNGVVYASIQRTPIAGATLRLLNAGSGSPVPAACFDDPLQQGQITRGDGRYKFDLNFSDPACADGATYRVEVAPPGATFVAGYSAVIPPTSAASTPLSVSTCGSGPNDAVPATPLHCEVQVFELAPPPTIPARTPGTNYYVHLTLDSSQAAASAQIFNNHIPLDSVVDNVVGISKVTPKVNVVLGELVPYEIVVSNQLDTLLPDVDIVDRFPAGFRYIEGSARIDGVKTEPVQTGQQLVWSGLDIDPRSQRSLALLLAVGAGVTEGEFTNTAQAIDGFSGIALSAESSASVRVVPDPDFACTDVLGKVFEDRDLDGEQDEGEDGLSGVRLVTARGLVATTDAHGRFHITCAVVPNERRGSNFILKLDDRSLPAGYRMSTPQAQVKRATRGKALRFSYGAAIHRVVGMDLADPVFEPGTTQMRDHWKPRVDLLVGELEKSPSTLRLSYTAEIEERQLVEARLDAVKKTIGQIWQDGDRYRLRIETEVLWNRAEPGPGLGLKTLGRRVLGSLTSPFRRDDHTEEVARASRTERELPSDQLLTRWALDPNRLDAEASDKLEVREVVTDQAETKKLRNVIPPIRFESGAIDIPTSSIDKLRKVLASMRHLDNVRLHLVGHADDQPLSGALARHYGDNVGLSRERAAEVAEFVQQALSLPPESISFDGAGQSQPVASNATAAGRERNRRVEVEVWYDVIAKRVGFEDFVIAEEITQVKVCRMETLCKMRFKEGHARRARIRNLVAPLQLGSQTVSVPPAFVREIEQALRNLSDEQNVTVKFIGYSEDAPLSERAERIYGTQLALSTARAHRVALAVKEALDLPTSGIASEGRGTVRPVASNSTERGRALNRRVEVEFWHDDPLQELPEEPQVCPDDGGREVLTRVYDPPWGRLEPILVEGGEPIVPGGYGETLERALADVADRQNPRLRFVGYVRNERLDRRTALAYGDDIGLATARARRTMMQIQAELGLGDEQVEHEGRGFLHSNDVVNAGFIQGDTSEVRVQIVYDELAVLDDLDGIDITPVTHELGPQNPVELNLMRISVNGEPIDDPGRSSADLQRCTDVALDGTDIRFGFDEHAVTPRLAVTSDPIMVPLQPSDGDATDDAATGELPSGVGAVVTSSTVRFRTYTNYSHFIDRMEVRIFDREQSVRAGPVGTIPVGEDGTALWSPPDEWFASPMREMKFVLRAYDADGRFDETAPQSLWIVRGAPASPAPGRAAGSGVVPTHAALPGASTARSDALFAGYGEAWPLIRNIPLGSAGTVRVAGDGIESDQSVALAGRPIPVAEDGRFVAEEILPSGLHTVEVAVEDEDGTGELFLRDLELDRDDWFFVGIADFTLSGGGGSGDASALEGQNAPVDLDSNADGRLAFYLTGKFGDDWKLTASADTREGAIGDLFSNFLDESPDQLFRRIDPDYHYPTYGDDGDVDETAPTQGKMYVKLSKDQSHLLWGNFNVRYDENELALVERGLYGGNLRYRSQSTTGFGEKRYALDGFAADPGTVSTREAFRGTGGSLYYLRRNDLTIGSDRIRIEIRDKDSGLVKSVVNLTPGIDYDIDYLQGRVLLSEPLSATVDDSLVVRTGGLSGDEVWLLVQYEYAPGFDEIDGLAAGGQGHFWIGDFLKLGATASRDEGGDEDSSLYAADLTLRRSAGTWLKLQYGHSDGLVASTFLSDDGGFDFVDGADPSMVDADANAYRVDLVADFSDLVSSVPGRLTVYGQQLDAGYSAPGLTALTETLQAGGTFDVPVLDALNVTVKADWLRADDSLETSAVNAQVEYLLTDAWGISAGVRNDTRKDDSPAPAATQEEGRRTDVAAEVAYDSQGSWRAYGFGQGTVSSTGDRESNLRYGAGGAYRVNDKLSMDGEVSNGDGGVGAQLGSTYQYTEDNSIYLTYGLENERSAAGSRRRGNLITGTKSRLGDSASVYAESRYTHSTADTGLVRAAGISMDVFDHWTVGANVEVGILSDRHTDAETRRRAAGGSVGFNLEKVDLFVGVEYRYDDTQQADGTWSERTTWLFRNSLQVQLNPDWRLLGKFNHSFSDSSRGSFFDGGYTEAVLGYAYRPVAHDRLHALAKYTYFYNMPTTDQVGGDGVASQFIQKSHIAAVDLTYDITKKLSIGGKYAFRMGEVSLDRVDPEFFDNNAHLYILRSDYRFFEHWEGLVEGRLLHMPKIDERKVGALLGIYRYFGKHVKAGVGYNFTDFSEDLTDLSYDHHGVFFNIVGSF